MYQGVPFRTSGDPVLYLSNPRGVDDRLQRDSLDAINALNQQHLDAVGDPEIATRINSFEMAFRMQASAPEAIDISQRAGAHPRAVRRRAGQAVVRQQRACWPGGWSSAACGSSSSSTKPGTSTATW